MRDLTCTLALLALVAGCSDRSREAGGLGNFEANPDAAAELDAGARDDGTGGRDAGPRPSRDAGKHDAGPAEPDAGMVKPDGSTATPDAGGGMADASTGMPDAGPPAPCPDHDLGDALGEMVISDSTAGAADRISPSCGGGGGPEVTLLWTAPHDGTFGFDTNGSSYDTVLSLRSGGVCTGAEMMCNDDGGESVRSRLRATLSAGEAVIVSVEGYSGATGDFVLNVLEGVTESETACTDGVDDDRDGNVDCDDYDCDSDPACTETDCTNGADDDGDGDVDCDDYDCDSDPACIESNCSDGLDDDGDGEIDCADYDCASEPHCMETDCSDGVDDEGDGDVDCDDTDCYSSTECGETMCSDGGDDDGDGRADCDDSECTCDPACIGADRCADHDLGMTVGASVGTGSNAGLCGFREGSCAGGGGAEVSYRFTAPSAGDFTFDTHGSSYDTQLYVLDGTCGGTELACNDDAPSGGLQSEVTVTLTAGQTVIVVVDGYSSYSRGNHVLNVTAP